MNPPAKLSDLTEALEFQSEESIAYFDRQTGSIVYVEQTLLDAVEEDDEESLTDLSNWQQEQLETVQAIVNDTGGRFIYAPSKDDFNEYGQMGSFIRSLDDAASAEQLWRSIKGRGAFRYFMDTLYRLGIEEQWYRHRDAAMKQFVIEWAEENDVSYVDDLAAKPRPPRA